MQQIFRNGPAPAAPASAVENITNLLSNSSIDRNARIALVHDWFPNFRGGERVVERICRLFPNAEIFTLFDFLPDDVRQEHFPGVRFHVSPVNRLPGVRRYYRSLFFLCPLLIEQFDLTGYDAVISSSAAFARGVITRPDQPHLCYVHSPARYAWDEQFSYIDQARLGNGPKGMIFRYMLHRLRSWDTRTAHSADVMVANSSYVRSRIRRIYGRDAHVVHPPVATEELPLFTDREDYYVTAAFHAPYKRTDLVIEAFNRMPSRKLVVVGDDVQSTHLRKLAGPNVEFAGFLPRAEYVQTIGRARALVYAGCEDFGITLAEAQACGTPLIAFGRGGARDIVRPLGSSARPTGVLFRQQTIASLAEAVDTFEGASPAIDPADCSDNAMRFAQNRFDQSLLNAFAQAQQTCQAGLELPDDEFLVAPGKWNHKVS